MSDVNVNQSDPEPIVIRASSLPTMFDCPHRWEAIHLLGKRMPSTAPSVIGSAVHLGAKVFDQARLDGDDPSLTDATDAAADYVRNPADEVDWDGAKPSQAIDVATSVTLSYCNDIAPRYTYTKVESKCDALNVRATNGLVLRFTGHIDRQRVQGNALGICDLKSGQRVVKADGTVNAEMHGGQLATYELLELMDAHTSGVPNILPAEIIALPTAGKQKPAVATVMNPHKVLIGNENQKGLIDYAADMLKSGSFYGNPRSLLCHPKYCPIFDTCFFRFRGE